MGAKLLISHGERETETETERERERDSKSTICVNSRYHKRTGCRTTLCHLKEHSQIHDNVSVSLITGSKHSLSFDILLF